MVRREPVVDKIVLLVDPARHFVRHIESGFDQFDFKIGMPAAKPVVEDIVKLVDADGLPQNVGKFLGFNPDQIKTGLLVPMIGNTYSGAAMIGLTAILDEAKPGDRILMVSYGSGAGSDAMVIRVTENIGDRQGKALKTQEYIERRTEIDYAEYARMRGKLTMK